jgi:hypothetical protein
MNTVSNGIDIPWSEKKTGKRRAANSDTLAPDEKATRKSAL